MRVVLGRELRACELSLMLGATLPFCKGSDPTVRAICTDSREADASTAFVALCGERVDGHDYIGAATERGCPVVIAQRADSRYAESSAVLMLVEDTEAALATLARAYLSGLSHSTVAVTGSVGKTTTKDMIHSVLQEGRECFCSSGNHNSVIGMPLCALELNEKYDCAVFEMGMSARGEIERMSLCARPDIAVITNVGTSHMEMLGSRENIRDAKMEIARGVREGGILLLNGDEPLLREGESVGCRRLYVSLFDEQADFFAKNISIENECTCFDAYWKDGCLEGLCLSVVGRHNVYAGLFALAVGLLLGATEEEIRRGLRAYTPHGLRQSICHYKDITLIEDCYNASPESMRASLDVLALTARGRRIACLGEMLELGENAHRFHREVGAYAARVGADLLFCIGRGGEWIAEGAIESGLPANRVMSAPDREEIGVLCKSLCTCLEGTDTVLIKGSRGVRLERVIEYLKSNY